MSHSLQVLCKISARATALCAEGEGDFFDAASLQCAPGVNIQALLAGGAAGGEHAGEEYDEEDEEEDGEEAAADGELTVTGHAVHAAAGQERVAAGDGASDSMVEGDVDVEHHEGEVIFKQKQ